MTATFTIAELLAIFRESLVALIPSAERARIVWHGPNVYDPWEEIERALFGSIVGSVAANAWPVAPCVLSKYGVTLESYADRSFITDSIARLSGERLVFIGMKTLEQPFDTMSFIEVGADFAPTGDIVDLPFLQVRPELAARTPMDVSYLAEIEYNE